MAEAPTPIQYAIGDLGPVRRHIQRLINEQIQPSRMLFIEMESSIERCVNRLKKIEEEN